METPKRLRSSFISKNLEEVLSWLPLVVNVSTMFSNDVFQKILYYLFDSVLKFWRQGYIICIESIRCNSEISTFGVHSLYYYFLLFSLSTHKISLSISVFCSATFLWLSFVNLLLLAFKHSYQFLRCFVNTSPSTFRFECLENEITPEIRCRRSWSQSETDNILWFINIKHE